MLVIGVDPGVSCGVAILEDGDVLRTFTDEYPFPELRLALEEVPAGSTVVVEQGPSWGGHNTNLTQEAELVVRESELPTSWVTPSQWKGTPASKTSVPRGISQHERDAVRLARWFMSTRRSNDRSTNTPRTDEDSP